MTASRWSNCIFCGRRPQRLLFCDQCGVPVGVRVASAWDLRAPRLPGQSILWDPPRPGLGTLVILCLLLSGVLSC